MPFYWLVFLQGLWPLLFGPFLLKNPDSFKHIFFNIVHTVTSSENTLTILTETSKRIRTCTNVNDKFVHKIKILTFMKEVDYLSPSLS